jgi:hypothetical protein
MLRRLPRRKRLVPRFSFLHGSFCSWWARSLVIAARAIACIVMFRESGVCFAAGFKEETERSPMLAFENILVSDRAEHKQSDLPRRQIINKGFIDLSCVRQFVGVGAYEVFSARSQKSHAGKFCSSFIRKIWLGSPRNWTGAASNFGMRTICFAGILNANLNGKGLVFFWDALSDANGRYPSALIEARISISRSHGGDGSLPLLIGEETVNRDRSENENINRQSYPSKNLVGYVCLAAGLLFDPLGFLILFGIISVPRFLSIGTLFISVVLIWQGMSLCLLR